MENLHGYFVYMKAQNMHFSRLFASLHHSGKGCIKPVCVLNTGRITSTNAKASFLALSYFSMGMRLAVTPAPVQALDKHVKAPLSSSKSTRNVRAALETNGRYALKTGALIKLFVFGLYSLCGMICFVYHLLSMQLFRQR